MKREYVKLGVLAGAVVALATSIAVMTGRPVVRTSVPRGAATGELRLAGGPQDPAMAPAYTLQDAFVRVAEKIKPAAVSISAIYTYEAQPQPEFYFGDPFEEFFKDFFGMPPQQRRVPRSMPRQYRAQGGGSGVLISEDGYILTNEHVIKDATELKVLVSLEGGAKEFNGKVVGRDARTDLAVIKIDARGLPFATLGDSDRIKVGEWVIAVGSPFGLEQTVTAGIVSALRQSISVEQRQYREFIQTDAAINRGNSGGPLCNLAGEVIGINTAIYAPTGVFSGIGFAIPSNRAKSILEQLIHTGKVTRGWLGVEIRPVDEVIARQFGLGDKKGVLINGVMEGTPAEKAGLKRGDIITSVRVGAKTTPVTSPQELQDLISSMGPRQKVDLGVFRDRRDITVSVTLGEMPDVSVAAGGRKSDDRGAEDEQKKYVWFAHEFQAVNNAWRDRLRLASTVQGVVVVAVDFRSKDYQDVGLRENDVVVGVNQRATGGLEAFKKAVGDVRLDQGVVFDIIRDGRSMFITYSK